MDRERNLSKAREGRETRAGPPCHGSVRWTQSRAVFASVSFHLKWDAAEVIWKVTAIGSATGTNDNEYGQSMKYFLEQNYPNPFNSDTIIQFTISFNDEVTLSIYDVMGQRINTLVNESLNIGTYLVSWDGKTDDGASVPSGVYFYRINAGSYVDVNRMLLLK